MNYIVNKTFEKTWPTNYHEDYYSTRHGWEYLGSDKKIRLLREPQMEAYKYCLWCLPE